MKRSSSIVCLAALAGLAAGTILVAAGPLNPAVGAVASTYKTLTEVEPRTAISATNTPGDASVLYRLTQPGSYYLTSNVTVPAGKSGILIGSDAVTIDLNGFAIIGQNGSGYGISTSNSSFNNGVIRNGTIKGMGSQGIGLLECQSARVIDVNVLGCQAHGIVVAGGSVVRNCTASYCAGSGIMTVGNCSIIGCTSTFNASGFNCQYSSDQIEDCVASNNTGFGFAVNNSVMTRCVADTNGGAGIEGGYGDRITGCRATYNTGSGIVASNACVVDSCSAVQNGQVGFHLGSTATIRNSLAMGNTLQGIRVIEQSTVIGNQVRYNGGGLAFAGIWLSGSQSTAQENQCVGNGYGIYASGTSNVIVRNNCGQSSTSNYYIQAGNRVGVITTGSANAALISGNSGGGMGITDPNANIAY